MLFADAHVHVNPIRGMGCRAIAKKFKEVGGWFMALVSLPPHHYGLGHRFEDYAKSIEVLVSECRAAREEGITVRCLAGVHPAELERLVTERLLGYEEAYSLVLKVLEYVGGLVKSGVLDGIGEVGRPHYKAIPEAFVINELVLRYSLTLARDLNAVIHLHLEHGGFLTTIDIADLIDTKAVSRDLVLMHHLDVRTAVEAEKLKLTYTLPGKLQVLREAVRRLKPTYMVESDFIDDPRRPGTSSYPWDIVASQKTLLSEGIADEEYLHRLNVDNVIRYYRVKSP